MNHPKIRYSKYFTPPKFLEMPTVSVEILPGGVSFFSTRSTDRGIIPDVWGLVPLPEGTVSQGVVAKREPLIQALSDIRQKTKVSFVRLSIPEEKTYTFKTRLPDLEPKEIRDILEFKIEENVPLSTKEAVFDFDVVPGSRRRDGQVDVVVSVAPSQLIEELQEIFNLSGLTPIFFSPESNNVARSVIREGNQQVVVIVNIRENNVVLSLIICGVVCQTSSISFGGSTFTDLLAKYFKVSPAEALQMKKDKLYEDSPDSLEMFSYLINTISALKDEIYKFVTYCNERDDVKDKVDRIILCGRDSLISGLDKYLSLNLNTKVEIADVWANNFKLEDYAPEISRPVSLDLAVVNGLSLF